MASPLLQSCADHGWGRARPSRRGGSRDELGLGREPQLGGRRRTSLCSTACTARAHPAHRGGSSFELCRIDRRAQTAVTARGPPSTESSTSCGTTRQTRGSPGRGPRGKTELTVDHDRVHNPCPGAPYGSRRWSCSHGRVTHGWQRSTRHIPCRNPKPEPFWGDVPSHNRTHANHRPLADRDSLA